MPAQKISLSINELLAEIKRRQSKLPRLRKLAARLQRKLDAVTSEIAALGGALSSKPGRKPGPKPGRKAAAKAPKARKGARRPKNEITLAEAIIKVLDKETPKNAAAIIAGITKLGYKSSSKNLPTIIYQTLAKDKRVRKTGRGLYALKD
jgi:hypothetical protein